MSRAPSAWQACCSGAGSAPSRSPCQRWQPTSGRAVAARPWSTPSATGSRRPAPRGSRWISLK
eukprot:9262594-Pyramimonas_sp.AAC.1